MTIIFLIFYFISSVLDELDVVHMDKSLQYKKPDQKSYRKLINVAARYLKEGLKDCIIQFSKENFKQLRLKVLKRVNTKECRNCPLDTLLPVHSSQYGRCPLGQMNCNCVCTRGKKPCPSKFCDVMYDEIIKQHRTSSDIWFPTPNETNWHHNHQVITKFFLSSNQSSIGHNYQIENLGCVDLLDIMINNIEFQKELFCKIDPPSDVVSKVFTHTFVP
jgi:hypothetical protein